MELYSEYNDDLARMVLKDGKYYYHWAYDLDKLYPIPENKLKYWQPQLLQLKKLERKLKLERLLS